MLDITGLGHRNNTTIITDIKNTVLLEDRTEHVLDNDRWRGVRDEAGFFMELLGKEIDSQIAVLASLGRSSDTNDLARAALKDQEIANANVVAGDSDGVGSSTTLDIAHALTDTLTDAGRPPIFFINDHLLAFGAMTMRMKRVEDAIGGFFKPVAERVVATLVIIITHLGRSRDGCFGFDSDFFAGCGSPTLVLNVVGWLDASAVVTFGDIDLFVTARNFDVDFGIGVALVAGLTIAVIYNCVSKFGRSRIEVAIIRCFSRAAEHIHQGRYWYMKSC